MASADRDFAGYRIIRPLELSGRASVWEAEERESGRTVAIETLAGDAAHDADVREWFSEAWGAAAEVDHPNVVTVEELGDEEGVPFAVRTPAGGTTLARRIAVHGSFEPAEAVTLLEQIGSGIEAAHEAGVVHGTLSPAAVIVAERDGSHHAYVTGFGRAEGDRREDVRELGSILAAMLGDRGAPGEEHAQTQTPADERAEALAGVVATAREDGYRTAAELVAAASTAIGREPGSAHDFAVEGAERQPDREDEEAGARSSGSGRRRILAVVALAAVVAVVVIVTGGGDEESASPEADSTSVVDTTTEASTTTSAPDEPPVSPPPAPIAVAGFPVGVAAREATVYAVTRESGVLNAFDQASGESTLAPVDLGDGAEDLTVVDGVAWATLPGSDSLARIDLAAAEPVAETIAVGSAPSGVIGALGSIWVVDEGSAELSRVPLGGGTAEAVPLDAEEPRGIAFGLGSLWVTDAAGRVIRVDPDAPEAQEAFEVGTEPRGVLVVDDHVWVANTGDGTVTELDPASGESREIEVGGSPRELAADPERLWVTNGDGFVSSVELDSDGVEEIDLSGAGGSPQGIAVGEQVWATTGGGDSLVAVASGE